MKIQHAVILLMLTAVLTALPFSLNTPALRSATTVYFFLQQMNSSFATGCGGGGATWCFNDTSPGPTITVSQGDTVNITVQNTDTTSHTFTLSAPYGGQSLTNGPGVTRSIEFPASTATSGAPYTCTFPGHAAGGMTGTFRVNAAATSVSPIAIVGLLLTAGTAVYLLGRRRH